ncbi:MAG: DUF4912 domain-containing protein [Acidobacteriota bacterium]
MNKPFADPASSFERETIRQLVGREAPSTNPGGSHNLGPELPERYERDRLVLMVQSPFWIFAYWEITRERILQGLHGIQKSDWEQFQLGIRWFEWDRPGPWLDAGGTCQWWFLAKPESRYRAQLCIFAPEYGVIPLVDSNKVVTPRFRPAPPSLGSAGVLAESNLVQRLVERGGVGEAVPSAAPLDRDVSLPAATVLSVAQVVPEEPTVDEPSVPDRISSPERSERPARSSSAWPSSPVKRSKPSTERDEP